MNLYRVYDNKADLYGDLFEERTHGSAKRAFLKAMSNDNCPWSQYPSDYSLVHVGSDDKERGVGIFLDQPVNVWTAHEALEARQRMEASD